jgi:ABC-type sulfate transport system permease component
MIDKALFGIVLLILILLLIWKKGKKSQNLALFLVLASNNRIPEAQSSEISLFLRILALIFAFVFFFFMAWYLSGKGQGEY